MNNTHAGPLMLWVISLYFMLFCMLEIVWMSNMEPQVISEKPEAFMIEVNQFSSMDTGFHCFNKATKTLSFREVGERF